MKQIVNKYKENADGWNSLIGILLSIISIAISIFTAINNPNNFTIAVSVVTCQIIVLIFCIISLNIIHRSKEKLKAANETAMSDNQRNQVNLDKLTKKIDQRKKLVEKLVVFHKNINKRINNFLTLACDESDIYYHNIYVLKEQASKIGDSDAKAKKINFELQKNEVMRYENSIFSLYNRYVKGVFEEVTNIITFYLNAMEKSSKVSLSMKLFDVTYCRGIDPTSIRIITAFRDKETYEAAQREIGGQHYSVSLNCDFQLCLSKENYIRNNITENAEDYANENYPNSLRYYNSTVVVPIICDYKSDKNIFGYLCCDTLNTDPSIEIFDKNVSDIMYSAALTIGMFFDTINSCWTYTEEFEKREFLTFVHDKCYKGN